MMNIEVTIMKPDIAVAIKRTKASMDNLVSLIDEMSGIILKFLTEQNKQPSGAPYCAYTNCSADFTQFDFELGIPVAETLPIEGELFMSKNCEGKAVVGMHKGAYNELETVYTAMMRYVKENALELTGVYYDYYLNDPADTPADELLTQIVFPVK